ncbi:NHL repeat [Popillia japonica]|uniref:NHL repeat n=1 Tax=Popillia japonica TaxID=7064 RepID=A0AAW1LHB8_POPJA
MSDKQNKTYKKSVHIDILPPTIHRTKSFKSEQAETRPRSDSISSIEELVQCPICFEKFSQPRMLPCQHTFCLACLREFASTIVAKNEKASASTVKKVPFNCPTCNAEILLENGVDSLDQLPRNVYIISLLRLLDTSEPSTPLSHNFHDVRCIKCETVCEGEAINCQHCKQIFCKICWGKHMNELAEKLSTLSTQLEDSLTRLNHKVDEAHGRCNQLNEAIKQASEEQIASIRRKEEYLLKDVHAFRLEEDESAKALRHKIAELQSTIDSTKFRHIDEHQKVSLFMNLHRNTSKILDDISHWGETRKIFDSDNFKLEEDNEGLNSEVEESQARNGFRMGNNPLENTDALITYYKTKSFIPKLQWTKSPKPAGVAVSPWSNNIYIAATDSQMILILNRQRAKIIGKIQTPEMLCPHGIAFSKNRKEMYVTDKWKHCIHVFSSFGDYLRSLCSKGCTEGKIRCPEGIAVSPYDELVVCDTGNDRVLILDPITGVQKGSIGWLGMRTVLNIPTSVAVTEDNKIIVADTGNHRIKIFNKEGTLLLEIGSIGRNKGQFRSAEVIAVDPLGFILVGDAGNSRIQIFDRSGSLIRVFGGAGYGPGQFKWISGIAVTPQLDIITTDHKSRSLQIF